MGKVNLAMIFNRADIARNSIFIAGVENGLKWTVRLHPFFLLVNSGQKRCTYLGAIPDFRENKYGEYFILLK